MAGEEVLARRGVCACAVGAVVAVRRRRAVLRGVVPERARVALEALAAHPEHAVLRLCPCALHVLLLLLLGDVIFLLVLVLAHSFSETRVHSLKKKTKTHHKKGKQK